MKTIEGKLIAQGVKVGIVAARFNEFITFPEDPGVNSGLPKIIFNDNNLLISEYRPDHCLD